MPSLAKKARLVFKCANLFSPVSDAKVDASTVVVTAAPATISASTVDPVTILTNRLLRH
jgi:hypothetical protein